MYGVNVKIPDGHKPAKKFDNRIEGSYSSSTIITWPSILMFLNTNGSQGMRPCAE